VDDFWYTYPLAKEPTLRGANLKVDKGEFVVVLGPSGCGKSTLAIALNGVIPHEMGGEFKGSVTTCGMDTRNWKARDLARKVGIVFQNPESQIIHSRVEDEVTFPMQNLLVKPEEMKTRLDEVLAIVGLTEFKHSMTGSLSGGQKQRLAIATALAMRPEVLILDEPTVHLDPRGIGEVISTIEKLNKEQDITILLIEHKLDEIIKLADKVVIMNEGRVVDTGPPRGMLLSRSSYIMEELGLFIPQVSEAAYMATKKGYRFSCCPVTVDEFPGNMITNARCGRVAGAGRRKLLEVDNLSFRYPSGYTAVRQLSASFEEGKVYAILGSNGSGKTTFAKLLVGLLKPTIGKISFFADDGTLDVSKTSPKTLCKYIGFAFQNPEHQFVTDRVYDEVAFGLQVSGRHSEAEIQEKTNRMLDIFGLKGYSLEHPLSLSMGQKRRLSIATILVLEPRLIIFDEPMTGQDRRRTDYIIDIINQLKATGSTSLFITHDMHFVADVATDVLVIEKGNLVFKGTPGELFNSPSLLKATSLTDPVVHRLALRLDSRLTSVIRVSDFNDCLEVSP
jgi:energy-coupling factor transport system ATP-binding protein